MSKGMHYALAAACMLSACGQPEAADPAPEAAAIHADGFNPATLDLDRPCTLLSHEDAERIYNQPYFRTIAADRVEDETVRCAIGVGAGGLHGLVEAAMVLPPEGQSAEYAYISMCRADAVSGPQLRPITYQTADAQQDPDGYRPAAGAAPAAEATPGAPPPQPQVQVRGRACRLANGAYALLLADRVLIATVRGGGGEIDREATIRLAAMLSRRVGIR